MSAAPLQLTCPYKGLIPYGEEDAQMFFGREDWCEIIRNNLLASHLTLLYGPSGVGKSSVLLAGVASRLRQQSKACFANTGRADFVVIVCRDWRDDPLLTLRERIAEEVRSLMGRPPLGDQGSAANLNTLLKATSQALGAAHSDQGESPARLLVILDQFEEYFLYHPREEGAGTFAEEFPAAINDSSLAPNVLISLRDDSLAKLDRFKTQIPDLFTNRLQIDHLSRKAAIDAIRKPIEEFNRNLPADSPKASVEPQLIQEVLEQVKVGQIRASEQEGTEQRADEQPRSDETFRVETPFLQLVMTRLWEEERHVDGYPPRLRHDTLERLGGAGTIVREHLQRLMKELPASSKRVAAIIFDKLVTSGLTKIAYPVYELTDPTKVDRSEDLLDRQELSALLDQLSGGSQRILRPLPSALGQPKENERYEIFHDVLAKPILEWRRGYRQEAALEEERQRHAQELSRERQRRRRNQLLSLGIGVPLFLASGLLFWKNQKLRTKEKQLTVIESAQQFNVQQIDQIDALTRALAAANWLKRKGTHDTDGTGRDIGANLRQILDHIQERFKAQLLSPEERRKTPPWISKIRLDSADVAILSRNGRFVIRSFEGQPRPLPTGMAALAQAGPAPEGQSQIKTFALADPGQRLATLSNLPQSDRWLLQVWRINGGLLWSDTTTFMSQKAKKAKVGSMGPFQMRNRLAFSPDGRRLAAATFDDTLRLFDLQALPTHGAPPSRRKPFPNLMLLRFSADGQRLAAADMAGVVHLIDPTTGSKVNGEGPIRLPKAAGFIFSLEFAPNRQTLAMATRDGKVRLYNLKGQLLKEIDTGRIFQLRFSPDGTLLAVGSRDGSVELLHLQALEPKRSLARFMNKAAVVDLRFSADGRQLITMSAAGMLHKWEVPQMPAAPPTTANRQLSTLAFSPTSNNLLWAMVGSPTACLLPLAQAAPGSQSPVSLPQIPCALRLTEQQAMPMPNQQPTDLARLQFSSDGSLMAGLAWDGNGAVWDRRGGLPAPLAYPANKSIFAPFSAISFGPAKGANQDEFAFVVRGGTKGELLICAPGQRRGDKAPCFARNVVDKRAKSTPLDLFGVQFLHHPRTTDPNLVLSVADGRLCLATVKPQETKDLEAKCFDIPSGQGELVVSADDAWIGLAGLDGTLYLWERKGSSFKPNPRQLKVSAGPLTRLTFHPDVGSAAHRFLAAVSLDGTASVWNLKGQQLALFRDEGKSFGGYLGAEFQRNGQLLLWTLNGSLQRQTVQDLPALITRGCAWLEDYRKGVSTPEEDKKSLAFCSRLGPR